MILLSKKENELNKDELLKLDIMKTLAMGKGYNPDDKKLKLDFRDGTNFERTSRLLIAKYNIELKRKSKDEKEQSTSEKTSPETPTKKKKKKKELPKNN